MRFGLDGGDTLSGGDHDDVILGDNGQIVRNRVSFVSEYPWINGMVWKKWPVPFDTEVIRDVRRYDDIDSVQVSTTVCDRRLAVAGLASDLASPSFCQGDDFIYGEAGNDILHGQRGNDCKYSVQSGCSSKC